MLLGSKITEESQYLNDNWSEIHTNNKALPNTHYKTEKNQCHFHQLFCNRSGTHNNTWDNVINITIYYKQRSFTIKKPEM